MKTLINLKNVYQSYRESYRETYRESYRASYRASYKESYRESYRESQAGEWNQTATMDDLKINTLLSRSVKTFISNKEN